MDSIRIGCNSCGEYGDVVDEQTADLWVAEHTKENPTHDLDFEGEWYPGPPTWRPKP